MNKAIKASKAKYTNRINLVKCEFSKNNGISKKDFKAVVSDKGDYLKVSMEMALNIF